MLRVVFFVLIATGTSIGLDDIPCHGLLNWTIIEPKAHLGSSPYSSQTVARNAVDGVVPGNGEYNKCAITEDSRAPEKKSLTIDLHRTYLISSIKTYLRQNWRAGWQTGLKVYVGPNSNTHEGNTQCGSKFTYEKQTAIHEPVFNCSPPVEGRFVFLLKNDANEPDYIRWHGLQVCEVEVKAVTFDRLPPLPNACSHNALLNATVTYHCEEGYVADGGKATSTCLENGTWSQPSLNCTAKQCPPPPTEYEDKELLLTKNVGSLRSTYACPHGKGPRQQTMHCSKDGQWIEDLESCKVLVCPDVPVPLPLLTLSMEENGNVIGSKRKYSCNDRCFELNGKASQTCVYSSDGRHAVWSSEVPTCHRIDCGHPSIIDFATSTVVDSTCGGTATYKCEEGYEMVGSPNVTCSIIGHWGEWPFCEPVDCGKPNDPLYGYHTKLSNNYKFKAEVEYACYYGYALEGKEKAVCLSSGNWDPSSPPKCEVMKCPELDPPKNGAVEVNRRNVNGTATFKCNSGYNLDGHVEAIRCEVINKVASWSHIPPTCEPVSCGTPPTISNGLYEGEAFTFGHSVIYECNVGYQQSGSAELECTHTGQWSSPPPNCSAVNCGAPPTVRNGHFKGNHFLFGGTVEYYCDRGFKRVRSSTLECIHTGKWYPAPTKCLELLCPYWRAPKNGESWFSGLIVGSIVHYSCNPGYTIAINDEKVDDIKRVSFRCIQIGNQDTARSMWKGALTSMPLTCKPSNN